MSQAGEGREAAGAHQGREESQGDREENNADAEEEHADTNQHEIGIFAGFFEH